MSREAQTARLDAVAFGIGVAGVVAVSFWAGFAASAAKAERRSVYSAAYAQDRSDQLGRCIDLSMRAVEEIERLRAEHGQSR